MPRLAGNKWAAKRGLLEDDCSQLGMFFMGIKNRKSVREREDPRVQNIFFKWSTASNIYFRNKRSFPIDFMTPSCDLRVGINIMECVLYWWPLVGDKQKDFNPKSYKSSCPDFMKSIAILTDAA